MTSADDIESCEAGAALAAEDVTALCQLVAEQKAQIARLRAEVRQLRAAPADAKAAAPNPLKPALSIARDAALSAAALAIAAGHQNTAPADDISTPIVRLPQDIYCDRLTFIKGLDIAAAGLLAGLGVTRFADIKAFTPEDVSEIDSLLGETGRVSKQGWIEQAQILAAGGSTRYSRQVEGGKSEPTGWLERDQENKAADSGATVIDLSTVRRARAERSRLSVAARAAGWGMLASSLLLIGSIAWQNAGADWQDALLKVTTTAM